MNRPSRRPNSIGSCQRSLSFRKVYRSRRSLSRTSGRIMDILDVLMRERNSKKHDPVDGYHSRHETAAYPQSNLCRFQDSHFYKTFLHSTSQNELQSIYNSLENSSSLFIVIKHIKTSKHWAKKHCLTRLSLLPH